MPSQSAYSLIDRLKRRAGSLVTSAISADVTILAEMIDDGKVQVFPDKSWELLTEADTTAVMMAAHINLVYRAMSDQVFNFRFGEGASSGDPQQIVDNMAKLLKELEKGLEDHLKANGIGDRFGIFMAKVTRKDIFNGTVPYRSQVTAGTPVTGLAVSELDGSPHLSWDRSTDGGFTAYHVLFYDSAGFVDSRYAEGIFPGVKEGTQRFSVIINRNQTSVKITGLSPATYYFAVAEERGTGVFGFSSEVGVVVT